MHYFQALRARARARSALKPLCCMPLPTYPTVAAISVVSELMRQPLPVHGAGTE